MNIRAALLFLTLTLTACATCREHPVMCSVVGAIALGSVAATIEQNQPDHRAQNSVRHYHLNEEAR